MATSAEVTTLIKKIDEMCNDLNVVITVDNGTMHISEKDYEKKKYWNMRGIEYFGTLIEE